MSANRHSETGKPSAVSRKPLVGFRVRASVWLARPASLRSVGRMFDSGRAHHQLDPTAEAD
jgi:hypothetical protein